MLSVFGHIDDFASPELGFAGAHHHMWLLQGCWGSELGFLCSQANTLLTEPSPQLPPLIWFPGQEMSGFALPCNPCFATDLKAMGPNDPAPKSLTRQEKAKPSLYILICLRYFVVVVVMEN